MNCISHGNCSRCTVVKIVNGSITPCHESRISILPRSWPTHSSDESSWEAVPLSSVTDPLGRSCQKPLHLGSLGQIILLPGRPARKKEKEDRWSYQPKMKPTSQRGPLSNWLMEKSRYSRLRRSLSVMADSVRKKFAVTPMFTAVEGSTLDRSFLPNVG